MFGWLFNQRSHKSKSLTPSEIAIIKRMLPLGDWRSQRLLAQATEAPYVVREAHGSDGYRVSIPYVNDPANLIELEKDIESPTLELGLADSGRKARFRVQLLRGGFLHSLTGSMVDGRPWPTDWHVDKSPGAEDLAPKLSNWLPRQISITERALIIANLEQWTGAQSGQFSKYDKAELRIYEPCTDRDISAVELEQKLTLPVDYRSFLRLTNGLDVVAGRPFVVAGSNELRKVDLKGDSYWLVTDLFEFGAVLMRPNSGEMFLKQDSLSEGIPSLKAYIVDTIRMLDDQHRRNV